MKPARKIQVFHGEVVRVDDDWREALTKVGIAAGQDWPRNVGDNLVSASRASKCYRMSLPDGRIVYFKRYAYPKRYWLKFFGRPGKAAVEYWAFQRLADLVISTLSAVAFGERRAFAMLVATFIVTVEVPDSVDPEAFAVNTWCHFPREKRGRIYRKVSGELVKQLRAAHRGRFFHHDLHWRNILLQELDDDYRTIWIDPPRASRMLLRERRGIVKDLSALARPAVSIFSKYEQMRFICHYLGADRAPGEAKHLYRKVNAHLTRHKPKALQLCAD